MIKGKAFQHCNLYKLWAPPTALVYDDALQLSRFNAWYYSEKAIFVPWSPIFNAERMITFG